MRNVALIALVLLGLAPAFGIAACAGGESTSGFPVGTGGLKEGGLGGSGLKDGGLGGTGNSGATGGSSGSGGSGTCQPSDDPQVCYSGPPGTEGVGECRVGSQSCVGGEWGPCQGETVPAEDVCDSLDNDCDGLADEEIGSETCGQGNCTVTVETCVNGVATPCVPGTGNATEECDGADDNCDGQVDEGCSCTNGQTQPCYAGPGGTQNVGTCKSGTQTCAGGAWGACNGQVLPGTELCNNTDDDCDGAKDEGNPESGATCNTGQAGPCAAGLTSCQSGIKVCVGTTAPSTEVCDAKDNNCNGATDEGNPGSGLPCSTGIPGPCGPGITSCTSGSIVCNGNVQPSTEVCDTVDNNCNGQADEGCQCVNGAMQGCYTGPPGTQGIGPCHGGTQTCASGQWGSCVGQVIPSSETCANGQDENCSGQADENCGCTHDLCTVGPVLVAGCDAAQGNCVAQICATDPYCCNTSWDTTCTSEVGSICNSQKCAGFCSHSPCVQGAALVSSCNACVSTICSLDPYCCNNFWDSQCVGEVLSYCGDSC
jgi:hypothetical protein